MLRRLIVLAWLHALAGCGATVVAPHAPSSPRPYSLVEVARGRPDAVVDLGDDADAALVSARWRHAAVSFVETAGVDPGPDSRPVPSATSRTHDLSIAPRREGWDAAAWEPFEPHDLGARRGHGHLSMGWVRLELVLPERIGATEVQGTTVAFEITADDYGEVWVNGRLPHHVGDAGGHVVAGWNAPNRVVLTTSAEPGMRFDIAVLVVNGPISRSPENFYWVRQAMLDVYVGSPPTQAPDVLHVGPGPTSAELLALDGARAERLATGFARLGSVLVVPDEGILMSDVEGRVLHRLLPDTGLLSVVQTHVDLVAMALDPGGRLVARHADGRVVRHERSGAISALDADAGPEVPSPPPARVGSEPVLGAVWGETDARVLYVITAQSLWRIRAPR